MSDKFENAQLEKTAGLEIQEKSCHQKQIKKYSDKDLDRILNKKFKIWYQKKQKEIYEIKKSTQMEAQKNFELTITDLKSEIDKLKNEQVFYSLMETARDILTEQSIYIPNELLRVLVCKNENKTRETIGVFAKLYNQAIYDAVERKLSAPLLNIGENSITTKTKIISIKDIE